MRLIKKKRRTDILPLSCNPELDQESIPGINAYYSDLAEVFNNPRIKNIAITGQRGVGKSSLLKSFDSRHRSILRRNPKFLYVSLGKYHDDKNEEIHDVASQQASSAQPAPQRASCKMTMGGQEVLLTLDEAECPQNTEPDRKYRKYDTAEEKNAIERRILLQLCAKFTDKNFPASGFRLIPKQPGLLGAVLFVVFMLSIFLLVMKHTLAELLIQLKTGPLSVQLVDIIDKLFLWNDCIEAGLYAVIFIGILIGLMKSYQWFCLKGTGAKLAVKTSNVEWNMEERIPEDYLDQFTQELIYCISRIGRKIDRTVVFEDMDRLDEEICVQIFTRLREINYLLNTKLDVDKYIRFIFVIDDKVANRLHYDKFFDYVMPVIPTLNRRSSEAVFREYLKRTNDELENTIKYEQLVPQLGVVGAKIIVYLDKHPLLKESCCNIRNTCIVVKAGIQRCCYKVISKTKTYLRACSQLMSVLSGIKNVLGYIWKYIVLAAGACWNIARVFMDFLGKCPAVRYLRRWLATKKANIRSSLEKKKALFGYHTEKRNCVGCDGNISHTPSCFRKMEEDAGGLIQLTAGALTDYRMMYTILNEYSLMMRMYHSNNRGRCSCKAAVQILAFQIYKHLWPGDYQHLVSGNTASCALCAKSVDGISGVNTGVLKEMLDKDMLGIDCLDYAGFSRSKVNELWRLRMERGPFGDVLKSMEPTNWDHQRLVQDHCSIKEGVASIVDISHLRDVIRFTLACTEDGQRDDSWFFEKRDIRICLLAMAALDDHEYINFIHRNKKTAEDNIFHKCAYDTNQIQYLQGKCTKRMAKIYAMGVPYNDINGIYILLKDETNQRSLVELISQEG